MKSPAASLIRIGTRGSKLALAQAEEVKNRLIAAHSLPQEAVVIVPITTTGDRITDRNLADIGGKGLFTKEIEEALLAGNIDIAVHSMKDMPAFLPDGLVIGALLPREDARDAFLSPHYRSISELPPGAVVGTSSSRRQAQLLHLRPDIGIIPFRGNVGTRLTKLQHEKQADATILAVAGLRRIHMVDAITQIIETEVMLPAVAQGAIGVECRQNDEEMLLLLATINHPETEACVAAERGFLALLEGNCRTPMAALAELEGDMLSLRALIATTDGKIIYHTTRKGNVADAEKLGRDAGEELKCKGGENFFL